MARVRFFAVAASDGVPLAATRFAPEDRRAAGAVVIASATGVPRIGHWGFFRDRLLVRTAPARRGRVAACRNRELTLASLLTRVAAVR